MKNLFFFLLLCIAFTATAQSSKNPFLTKVSTGDTLETSTTLLYDYNSLLANSQDFAREWAYSLTVVADSVSGANAGTITLQVSDTPASVAAASADWVDLDTDTIDGTGSSIFYYSGTLNARRLRLKVTSPSGTRKTAIRVNATLKDFSK